MGRSLPRARLRTLPQTRRLIPAGSWHLSFLLRKSSRPRRPRPLKRDPRRPERAGPYLLDGFNPDLGRWRLEKACLEKRRIEYYAENAALNRDPNKIAAKKKPGSCRAFFLLRCTQNLKVPRIPKTAPSSMNQVWLPARTGVSKLCWNATSSKMLRPYAMSSQFSPLTPMRALTLV